MKIFIITFMLSFSVTVFATECTVHADDAQTIEGVVLEAGKAFPNSSSCEAFKSTSPTKYACDCPKKEEPTPVITGESKCGDEKVAGKGGVEEKKKLEGGNTGGVEN